VAKPVTITFEAFLSCPESVKNNINLKIKECREIGAFLTQKNVSLRFKNKKSSNGITRFAIRHTVF
jgi:hypothetical protein